MGLNAIKKGTIRAIHDEDMIQFLESIGEYEFIKSGKATCHFCGSIVNINNIYSVFPIEGKVAYCCSGYKCYQKLLKEG